MIEPTEAARLHPAAELQRVATTRRAAIEIIAVAHPVAALQPAATTRCEMTAAIAVARPVGALQREATTRCEMTAAIAVAHPVVALQRTATTRCAAIAAIAAARAVDRTMNPKSALATISRDVMVASIAAVRIGRIDEPVTGRTTSAIVIAGPTEARGHGPAIGPTLAQADG
jgi:hypothetical protein